MATGDHIGLHARLGTQYARHVFGLRTDYSSGGLIPMFSNPTAACHGGVRTTPSLAVYPFPNTPRGTLVAPPKVLPFGWMVRYFFFAAFFAAFFTGAFTAAFLVAICLFSLFDALHRICNTDIAVEECIDSRRFGVKRKTMCGKKKEQQRHGVQSKICLRTQIRWYDLSNASAKPAMRSCQL
jgi:hypothetical protein